jgi:hypothetical protein
LNVGANILIGRQHQEGLVVVVEHKRMEEMGRG